jgi:Mg2+-importing ATPase
MGAILLAAVVAVALRFSEGQEFVRLARGAEPWWLLLAVALQAGTYLAQAGTWRSVAGAARFTLSLAAAYKLSLAKLFVDQALPTGGVSGTILVAKSLENRGMSHAAVMAGVVVTTASYYAAYVFSLIAALIIVSIEHRLNIAIVWVSLAFLAFAVVFAVAVIVLSTPDAGLANRLAGFRPLTRILELLRDAEPRLARNPWVLLKAMACQIAIFCLDAATVWVLILALGALPSAGAVFASFMFSSVFRSIGVLPGGLGVFEATSVLTLTMAGVSVPVGLAATLIFRGLSFWLPMLPGLWFSRGAVAAQAAHLQPTDLGAYWSATAEEVLSRVGGRLTGLTSAEAAERLARNGPNELKTERPVARGHVFWTQLRSPLLLLLLLAAGASAFTEQWADAAIVLLIVLASTGIGFSREFRAQEAIAALRERVGTNATVVRDGQARSVPLREVVPGDVVLLSAGSLVPADARVLEATDFFVNEAVLTGESFPAEKKPGAVSPAAGIAQRTNCVFLGTNVRSGAARCLVVDTGLATQFGGIAHRLALRPPETEFDRGIRHFGYLLMGVALIVVIVIFAANTFLGRPPVETLLFAVALAVGLSPELLPAILTVNLARGAQTMARHGVLVRRLSAIENLGSIDVLCTDKTGTLTEGVVRLEGAYDVNGQPSDEVGNLAACNAALQTGFGNPLDEAILQARTFEANRTVKLAEIPYDFVRRRMSVVVRDGDAARIVAKGAFEQLLAVCTHSADGSLLEDQRRQALRRRFHDWSAAGARVLAVATRRLQRKSGYSREDENDLDFVGFLVFLDRAKPGVAQAIRGLQQLGVRLKLITGDARLVAEHVASLVGIDVHRVLTGKDLDELHDEALWRAAETTDLFVEVDPNQKERIILSLKKMGHVVGFLGDGVNDAPAMHAADTSLSVEKAVDVAREAADFVLLKRDLEVIRRGIQEGRKTFANTLKYVLTTTSANLGNMISMAIASLFLPFLPLLAGQILLNNFLSDIPAIGLADDGVDRELVERPRRWDMRFIGRFMVEFGVLSSLFDFLTFAALLGLFAASVELFRTGWFVESLLTELLIALVVRTRRPFFRSRPSTLLLTSTVAVAALAFIIPYLPFAHLLGFVPLPFAVLATLATITGFYVATAEALKQKFYRPNGMSVGAITS